MSKKYFDIFVRESQDNLKSLQEGLLLLEREPDNTELVRHLLRNAHTIKGSARMLGFEGISSIAHAMEDYLKEIESGEKAVDDSVTNRLLQGCDAIAGLTSALITDATPPIDVEQFLAGFKDEEFVAAILPQQSDGAMDRHTVKVKVETLDRLINLAGELFICRQRLEDRLASVKAVAREAENPSLKSGLKIIERELEDDLQQLQSLVQLSHSEALALRMLPLNSITDDFKRSIRDLSRSVGKDVKLEVRGGQIEVDRGVLDALKPALVHIINNAVVHGIEIPEQRQSAGKPAHGTIRITASHKGDHARITIRDDGRGMNADLIKRKAIDLGVLDADSAKGVDDNDALYFTLRHGFSTTDAVTDLAGRGVGLDVVSSILEKMKGDITLASEPNRFFEISVQFPLTLSLVQSLIVNCSGELFAMPIASVVEVVKIRECDICGEQGDAGIYLHGVFVRLLSLSALLGLPASQIHSGDVKLQAIVLGLKGEKIAFSVDSILRDEEVVIKGFGRQLVRADFIQGATVLGNGDPVFILNVHDLFAVASGRGATTFGQFSLPARLSQTKGSILVVDDSITSRTIEQSILSANGYRVETADSGESALLKLASGSFDLMISDIEMPGISGLELVKKVLSMPEHRQLPVVMVSSLSSSEDRNLVFEAGAKAYMTKGDFDQGLLLSLVEELINSG
ncbi:gliding motility regulatory protein [Geobacter sp. OR-1]|uniref:hybrid sensor histidine kinase/response regulator n=1 Tax=Geobacter sp. OR-1 TaxID=1266765 RepID=UPI000543955F|nr:response regulator [Geobacter sp. OR-1]GAM09190.1 gliding motility regulatory protein [Geobacter sp. OR-1]